MRRRPLLFLALLAGCAGAPPQPACDHRALFVGNSLTYYNDLPGLVRSMHAAARPGCALETEMLAQGGAKIADHLHAGRLAALLEERRFDVVVLQDLGGFPDCDKAFPGCEGAAASVCEATRLARESGARPVLLGTWQGSAQAQERLSAATREEARRCGLELADAGAAMQRFRGESAVSPWAADGHPALAGSWIAAATLTRALLGAELPPGLVVAPSCRPRWKGAALVLDEPASTQLPPESDCEMPPAGVGAAAIRAANPRAG